ncbi:MAG: polyamine ABC transporter substrate-binding protein [Deltaproteobacteria bacterium]|nr:polyamine ABC transporter substrate-binding protein [Deltaproteobacteria bacterium]
MKKLPFPALIVAVSLLLFPGGVTGVELAEKQHIRVAAPVRDIRTMDPAYSTLTGEKTIVSEMTNGLLRMPYGRVRLDMIEGDLAEKWDVSEDLLTWTFYLRKGVKWHKGYGEVTAEDVKFSLERVKDPATGSPWAKKYAAVESIEVINPLTVRIKLKKADPFFELKLLGYHGGQIVPKKAVEKLGKDFAFNPVGSGPFVFHSYQKGQGIVLKRNPDYFRGAPILETVEYIFMPDNSSRLLALERGEVDMGRGVRSKEWAEKAIKIGLKLTPPLPPQQCILVFNMTRKPLDDIRVRRALAHALDRDLFVDLLGPILGGPQISPVPPGYFGHIDMGMEKYEYNPELAKKLLAEAGYPKGFSLGEAVVSESWSYLQPMKIVQEQWRQIGVELKIKVVDHPTYHSLIRKDVNPVVIYGGVRLPVADTILTQFYHSASIVGTKTAVTNFSHYGEVIPGIDEFLDKAANELDREKRKYYYALAQYKIIEDLPAYPLFLNKVSLCIQKWVDLGYDTNPYESLYYLVEISEKTRLLKH